MNRFLGYSSTPGADEPSAPQGLPASWYRSSEMYELERRAIFSKKWLLVTHRHRFSKAGDYVRFTEAGFSFFLCMDRQGNVNAFHNVCRHRAYPVVNKDSGTASIIACKYHGWSYSLNGKLAKAPRFDTVESFDKAKNDLYPIHTHIDALGFIWVNLEAAKVPSADWTDDFGGVDLQPRLAQFQMAEYTFDHAWSMVGDYNWKTLADNYNECYHCPTAHPGVVSVSDLSKYYVDTQAGHIQHFSTDKSEDAGLKIASTFYYPNASLTLSPHFFYIMRCVPASVTTCSMEYEVYRHKNATDEEFHKIDSLFKQVLKEDKDLCNAVQKNLNAGVFVNGKLHPFNEKGPLYFQKLVRKNVMDHRAQEEKLARRIWPMTPAPTMTDKLEEEISFCEGLGCDSPENGALAW
ncbi:iron-sulfur cluster-binding protein [Lasiodiplodia theobromae]|nr:iron-sulfur cluster-binding protein [Lasiodiplodia theobromae]